MSTAFDLMAFQKEVAALLAELEEGDEQAILLEALNATEDQMREKLGAFAWAVRQAEASAKTNKEYADQFRTKAQSQEALAKRLKETMGQMLDALGGEPVESAGLKVAWQMNGGKLPLVVDEATLDQRFTKTVVEPDRDAIRQVLEAGGTVQGAHLEERGRGVRIR